MFEAALLLGACTPGNHGSIGAEGMGPPGSTGSFEAALLVLEELLPSIAATITKRMNTPATTIQTVVLSTPRLAVGNCAGGDTTA